MFKFQTTTLLNGATVAKLAMTTVNGLDVSDAWRSADYDNAKLVGVEPGESTPGYLAIERLGKFSSDAVTHIYHRPANPGVKGKVEITCAPDATISSTKGVAASNKGIYRLNLYIRLGQGSMNSNFANVWVFKGKPLAFEYLAKTDNDATPAKIADGLEARIKYETTRFGSKNIKVSNDGNGKLTIEACGPDACYQWFTTAELQKFNAAADNVLTDGEYIDIAATVTNTMCEYPFGTYDEILKDLRLPTPEHTGWATIQLDEMPVLNKTYDQFMIYMCVNRGIMGGDAVGEVTKSVTAHSIWVPSEAATAFAALLRKYTGVTPEDYKKENLSNTQDNKHAFEDAVKKEPDLEVTE